MQGTPEIETMKNQHEIYENPTIVLSDCMLLYV